MFRTRLSWRRWPAPMGTVVVVGLLAVLGGTAYAAIPNSNDRMITGCYQTALGNLRVIDAQSGQRCLPAERQLEWNQAGAPGPKGDPGPSGPQGPAGAPGTSGDEVFFAIADKEDAAPSFRLPKALPAGSYLVTAEISAIAADFSGGGRTTVLSCSVRGAGDTFKAGRELIMPAVNNSRNQLQTALTAAFVHPGGEIALRCLAEDGEGVRLEATLLATKVASVG